MTGNDVLSRFAGCPVLVVGDLMLDEFVWGQVSRISPEAPVPVVEVARRSFVPGGAANTAANVGGLGGRPVPERAVVEGSGGRIAYLPLVPGVSTTELLKRIREKGGAEA